MSRIIYDSMNFDGKPSSVDLGLIYFPGVGQWALHGGAETPDPKDYTQPDETWYRYWARRKEDEGETLVWLNLEAWKINASLHPDNWHPDATTVEEANQIWMQNKLDTLVIFRDEAPSVEWQAYNWTVDDQSVYYSIATGAMTEEKWQTWRAFNDEYCLPALEVQGAIYISCYLNSTYTHAQWELTEGAFLEEVHRLVPDKRVYAVLRFRYPEGDEDMVAGGPHLWIPPERMDRALKYLHSLGVDGFMMWSPGWPLAMVSWSTPELQALWSVINNWMNGGASYYDALHWMLGWRHRGGICLPPGLSASGSYRGNL